jgi:hypothetical protein
LPLAREIGAFDHLAFLCCSNSLLKFLWKTTLDPLRLYNHLLWPFSI